MGAISRFFATYEGLIYILLILGGLFAFRGLWISWREWRQSIFGLEREFTLRRFSQALAVSIMILFLFFTVMFMASFVAPASPSIDLLSTPTLNILDQGDGILSGDPALVAGTIIATIPTTVSGNGCIPNQLILTSPEPGQEIQGSISLQGTVNVANFGFYKFEVSPREAETWGTISAGTNIIINGEVGVWDTSILTPGDYDLRLIVTDNQGNSLAPCVIPVRVIASP